MASSEHRKTAALDKAAAATRRLRDTQREIETAVARAAHWGATWSEVAAALDVTAQAAHKRFRRLRYDPATGHTWHEPPLPM